MFILVFLPVWAWTAVTEKTGIKSDPPPTKTVKKSRKENITSNTLKKTVTEIHSVQRDMYYRLTF
jgi:hypothetical protein